jgi:stage VI sporulation protein D
MKKVVPFTKTITFRTMIAEITNIEVKHNLKLKSDYEIDGDILIDGTYKMTDASQIEEKFHYKLPFTIAVDSKYSLDDLEITIGDFYFEIINEEDLKINIDIDLNGLEEKLILDDEPEFLKLEEEYVRNDDLEIPVEINENIYKFEIDENEMLDNFNKELEEKYIFDDEIEEDSKPLVEVNQNKTVKSNSSVGSIFASIPSSEETFSTYYVYVVGETDTVESIIDKYKTTREELLNYNDLTNVKVGSKLIIPCINNE